MLAMNYQLTLPHTFDMDALRERIPLIGTRFDDLPGLGFKAFLFRELLPEASDRVDELAGGKNVHSVAFTVDPRTWTSVQLTLLTQRPEGDLNDEVYEVPYLSVSDLGAGLSPQVDV